MGFGFLNAAMLIGLATIVLPVLAHLISRRRYDVVNWGAMRFLELGQRTRQRIRLQDLLLLLLRMLVLACVAIALARPWGSGGVLSAFGPQPTRDFVFILDGSSSMAWNAAGKTPHQSGLQWLYEALEQLHPGDTVALIDARSRPRRVVAPPTTDLTLIRDALSHLPAPSGPSNLPAAIEEGIKILSTTSNLTRQIIVLSDDQRVAWQMDDDYAWARVEELRSQASIRPDVSVVSLSTRDEQRENFSMGRIELSRSVTVPEFPIQLRAIVRRSGGSQPVTKTVSLEVDGQKLAEQDVRLPPSGEAAVTFPHAFQTTGRFRVSLTMEHDALAQDDDSAAVVTITNGLPVLLVDGDRRADPTRSETFYIRSAFAASGEKIPWVAAQVISPEGLTADELAGQSVVFLCNVSSLSLRQWKALEEFVRHGGGLVIAPGEKTTPWEALEAEQQAVSNWLPARYLKIDDPPKNAEAPVTIDSQSLAAPWLQRFRQESGVDFWQTRLTEWWKMEPVIPDSSAGTAEKPGRNDDPNDNEVDAPSVAMLGTNGVPLLTRGSWGDGSIVQLAFPLDADWSTLPAKNDFVPFLHELTFLLSSDGSSRNVDVGAPLMLALRPQDNRGEIVVDGPGIDAAPTEFQQQGSRAFAVFRETTVPGTYYMRERTAAPRTGDAFVVDNGRSESDLTPLAAGDWKELTAADKIDRIASLDEAAEQSAEDIPRAELWWGVLLLVLALLIGEVALTRKMVQGGHAVLDSD